MKNAKHTFRLPGKPSELIRVALADLEKVEKNPRYIINMDIWHSPKFSDKKLCGVCLAGSIIACRSGYTPSKTLSYKDLPNQKKMSALNYFRKGDIVEGCEELGLKCKMSARPISKYEHNAGAFKQDMQTLANDLEAYGL
jgi:hypothetical protein